MKDGGEHARGQVDVAADVAASVRRTGRLRARDRRRGRTGRHGVRGRCGYRRRAGKHAVRLSGRPDEAREHCELCVEACRRENHLSDDTPDRRRISLYVNAKGENVTLSTSCMHCAEPSCLQVCPAGAITKGEAGIVAVDQERVHRVQVLLPGMPVRGAALQFRGHGQVRLLPGRGSAGGRHAALRSRVQVRRAALRAA